MQLKRQSEIAIGVLAACARRPGITIPAQQIAQEIGTTKDHAYQVVALLVRNGFLQSERGPGGGVQLNAEPHTIKLVDVLRLTEPAIEGAEKSASHARPMTNEALLDRIVETASSFFVRLLDRFTIADLVAPENAASFACLDCRLTTTQPETWQAPSMDVIEPALPVGGAGESVRPVREREPAL